VKERLVRVTSEAGIRAGAIYVIKDNLTDGRTVRFMLLGPTQLPAGNICSTCRENNGPHYGATPIGHNEYGVCLRRCIPEGRLFRVEDPKLDLDEENPYLVGRPLTDEERSRAHWAALASRGWL
jgi:hypothetical protein